MTRRHLLVGTGSVLFGNAFYAISLERWRIETTTTRFKLRGLTQPIRLLQLSDIHQIPEMSWNYLHHVIDLALATNPDLIVLTGDFIDKPSQRYESEYAAALRRLARRAPTYAVLGNHDGSPFRAYGRETVDRTLSQAEIQVLHNENLTVLDGRLALAGVADLWSRQFDPDRAFDGIASDVPAIFLNHNPDGKDLAAHCPWDLMLSGHTHGNHLRPPFVDSNRWAVVRDLRYIRGRHEWNGRQLYVNRGIGGLHGIRYNCPPEISVHELS
jgi:predicted MPP superfamily phosphohydrolase